MSACGGNAGRDLQRCAALELRRGRSAVVLVEPSRNRRPGEGLTSMADELANVSVLRQRRPRSAALRRARAVRRGRTAASRSSSRARSPTRPSLVMRRRTSAMRRRGRTAASRSSSRAIADQASLTSVAMSRRTSAVQHCAVRGEARAEGKTFAAALSAARHHLQSRCVIQQARRALRRDARDPGLHQVEPL